MLKAEKRQPMKDNRYRNFMLTMTKNVADERGLTSVQDFSDYLRKSLVKYNKFEYAVIIHDKDEAEPHYHVALSFKDAKLITTVANSLNIAPNFLQRWDSRKNNLFSYLFHKTADAVFSKFDYSTYIDDDTKFTSNVKNIQRYTVCTFSTRKQLDDIQKKILTGDITRRNLLTADYLEYYALNKKQLDVCFELRQQSLIVNPPNCTTIFISGNSGTGKTTLAKKIASCFAQDNYCFASSSNDPLQDYYDEKVFIIDDFRPQQYDFIDLLALLDPYARTRTYRSRYKNKTLATELIIITSVIDLDSVFNYYHVYTHEDVRQLRRRIDQSIIMATNNKYPDLNYSTYCYNQCLDSYYPIDNPF